MLRFKQFSIVYLTLALLSFSLIFLSSSSLSEANFNFGDGFFFIKKQLLWALVGLVTMVICSKINLNLLKNIATPIYLLSLILLVLVLLPEMSTTIFGAKRWLSLGFFSFQPTEIFKFAAIVYFSTLFSRRPENLTKKTIFSLGAGIILILIQPNMSSVILITAIILTTYYLANGNIVHLSTIAILGVMAGLILTLASPYRSSRLQTLLSPETNLQITGYHTNQIIVSLASGGLFGKGLGNSSQKYQYLPQLATDSILAIIGEELGFFGISLILLIYYLLISQILRVAKTTPQPFEQYLVSAIGFWIAFQTIINAAAISILIPLTGIPLPFISYGGSSLITLFAAIGLVTNVQMKYTQASENPKNHRHHRHSSYSSHRTDQST